jgi:hypothetical protein
MFLGVSENGDTSENYYSIFYGENMLKNTMNFGSDFHTPPHHSDMTF